MEAIGLIVLGLVMLVTAPFRYYRSSWRSPWQVAKFGLICLTLGAAFFVWDVWG